MKLIFAFALMLIPTMVQADELVQEVTYEDLVQELSARQRPITKSVESPFDSVKLHAGLGLVNSFSTFRIREKNSSRYQNGMQLSVGVDLFSPNWMAEAAWRNFGLTRQGSEEHYLREMDLKLAFHDAIDSHWNFRVQGGLAHRSLRLTDPQNEYSIDENTPGVLASGGLILQMSPMTSLNFDLGGRVPVISNSVDKGSIDFALELKLTL
jgi:hypothetical protein